nr:MAG TPA: hypothetical protein [Caudoviricetes sp.]
MAKFYCCFFVSEMNLSLFCRIFVVAQCISACL